MHLSLWLVTLWNEQLLSVPVHIVNFMHPVELNMDAPQRYEPMPFTLDLMPMTEYRFRMDADNRSLMPKCEPFDITIQLVEFSLPKMEDIHLFAPCPVQQFKGTCFNNTDHIHVTCPKNTSSQRSDLIRIVPNKKRGFNTMSWC